MSYPTELNCIGLVDNQRFFLELNNCSIFMKSNKRNWKDNLTMENEVEAYWKECLF